MLVLAELQNAKLETYRAEHPLTPVLHDWRVVGIPLLQHLASALIVASFMGVTYEYFVHKHVIDDFDELLREHERATETTFNAFRATTARDVFSLLANVASHSEKIPTIFDPPRGKSEVVFATDQKFFERLIGSEKARAESVEVLAPLLESPSIKTRFLAIDFVGMLRLHELAPRLRELAADRQKDWGELSPEERGCVLNYWWAASRCEVPPYQLLKVRLLDWQEPFVQKWILFVAKQMPDDYLAQMVKVFIRVRGATASRDVMEEAISAIAVLHNTGSDMRSIVKRYEAVFRKLKLWDDACTAVSAVPAHARGHTWRSRLRRVLQSS
jgi:hypothetical protein